MPSFHKSLKSLTNSRKYISIFFLRSEGLRIIRNNIKFGLFIHIQGGRLYTVNITTHMLYIVLILPYELKLSLVEPNRTLQELLTNHSCLLSNSFYTIESTGCLRVLPSSFQPSLCHCISLAISSIINNRCNLDFIGKYYKTF
jgi:hypothetical protein